MEQPQKKMYLYRHGNDTDAFGNDIVRLFSNRERAMRYMQQEIESFYNCSWEEFVEQYGSNSNNVIETGYVEIAGYKWTNYYMVDAVTVDAA